MVNPLQEQLPIVIPENEGRESVQQPVRQPRLALVHMLTPDFAGVNPEEFADVTFEDMVESSPMKLRASLIDVPRNGTSAVGYWSSEERREVWLGLTPAEFRLLARHPAKLGQTAMNATKNAYSEREQRTDEVRAKAKRSAIHAVESRQSRMTEYAAVVAERLRLIDKFVEMDQYPNLVRAEITTTRERFQMLRQNVIENIISAAANQEDWAEAHSARIEKAVVRQLYIEPNLQRRYRNFNAILDLGRDYNRHKLRLIQARHNEVEHYIHVQSR